MNSSLVLDRRRIEACYLGRVPFQDAWDLQRRLAELRADGEIPDTLLLLEHPHTYSLGRIADPSNILLSRERLAEMGVSVVEIDRGGDVTYHGPGQLVGYPIMLIEDRRDLLQYIRKLEEVLIRALADFEIAAGRIKGLSGVWLGEEKIAAIGVKMARVTSHGFALNVAPDMSFFRHIIPCGIKDKGVTSMERQVGMCPALFDVAEVVARRFAEVFELESIEALPDVAYSPAAKPWGGSAS